MVELIEWYLIIVYSFGFVMMIFVIIIRIILAIIGRK